MTRSARSFYRNCLICMRKNERRPVCLTCIGGRSNQEDNFLLNGVFLSEEQQERLKNGTILFMEQENCTESVQLYAVSDGMGGHRAGEVASRICVKRLAEMLPVLRHCIDKQEAMEQLQRAVGRINAEIGNTKEPQNRGMGATLVAMLRWNDQYSVLNIGDSRAYAFGPRGLIQLTRDQTEGERLLSLGLLTRRELAAFPDRKRLSRYLGYAPEGFVMKAEISEPENDTETLLLCSDGITDVLSDERISQILTEYTDLKMAGKQILNEATVTTCADNATVILIPLRM